MIPKFLKPTHTLMLLVSIWGIFCLFCFFLGRPRTLYVDQHDLEPIEISLPQPPECWNYTC